LKKEKKKKKVKIDKTKVLGNDVNFVSLIPEIEYDDARHWIKMVYSGSMDERRSKNWSIIQKTFNETISTSEFESRLKYIALPKNSLFQDMTFIVEGKNLTGHKILFAANSGFFEGILEIADDQPIHLNMTLLCFNAVKNYLYSNPAKITEKNVLSVLREANKLLIDGLEELCVTTILSPNIFEKKGKPTEVYLYAKQYGLEQIKAYCWWYFKMNFPNLKTELQNMLTKAEYLELKETQYPGEQYYEEYRRYEEDKELWIQSNKKENCSIQ